jgi:Polyketide cyclase / dehydrase and lipid transport
LRAAESLIAQQSVEIKGSQKAVWALVKDFGSLQKWHPAFKDDVIKSGKNNTRGAVRTLTLSSGESFDEELLKYDDQKMFYRYRIVGESPLPLTNYVSTMHVTRGRSGMAKVIWQGKFNGKPDSGKTDQEVVETLNAVYREGLDNVKKLAERG